MSDFSRAMRNLKYLEEIGQDDKVLRADITRLVYIAKSIAEEYGELVSDVFVSPADILQTPLSEIDEIGIMVYINPSVNAEPRDIPIKDFVEYYLSEEYPELEVSKIEVTHKAPEIGSFLNLYTREYENEMDEEAEGNLNLSDMELLMFKGLCDNQNFMIETPKNWNRFQFHTILIHVLSSGQYISLVNGLNKYAEHFGITLTEAEVPSKYVVVPIVGFDKLPYDIPYDYLYAENLDLQRIEELLKEKEET